MIHQRITLPSPFHLLEVFSLVEPVEETETEVLFRHRLYLVNPHAEGGKTLLKDLPAYAMPKRLPVDPAQTEATA